MDKTILMNVLEDTLAQNANLCNIIKSNIPLPQLEAEIIAKNVLDNVMAFTAFCHYFEEIATEEGKEIFLNLVNVAGCHPYHKEGNALKHSFFVFKEMRNLTPRYYQSDLLRRAAFLHDIGKVATGRPKNGDPNNWEYPNHSNKGADILNKFVSTDNPDFKCIEWLIRNHIKPLFWLNKGTIDYSPVPCEDCDDEDKVCTIANLALMGLCDIRGSISEVEQTDLHRFLRAIAFADITPYIGGKREVIGMHDGVFDVHLVCHNCEREEVIQVPIEAFVSLILDEDSSKLQLPEEKETFLSECWCTNCATV